MIESIHRSVSQSPNFEINRLLFKPKIMESIAKLFNITTTFAIDSRYNELLHIMNTRYNK